MFRPGFDHYQATLLQKNKLQLLINLCIVILRFQFSEHYLTRCLFVQNFKKVKIRGLLEKYPTFCREKETGLLGALDT
jgi:hypothetical protein